jgi:3',5'-cyclic AMP phosphodiesterase CpdA
MTSTTAGRLLLLGALSGVFATCDQRTPAGPTPPPTNVAANLIVSVAPAPLVAAHAPADPETKYRIPASLTFKETGGKAARITRLQVTVSGASGWTSTAVHTVDIPVPAKGTNAFTVTSVVDIGGPDTAGTWRLDAAGSDADGVALTCRHEQADLRIVDPPVPEAVLVGAGDMAGCGLAAPVATARLLDRIPGIVFTAGDNVYPVGSPTTYAECYGQSWGRHLWRTRPLPGNHDWDNSGSAAAYFSYFGSESAPPHGYYSYTAGAWHVVALNSNVAAHAGSAQYEWLHADLAASAASCVLAVWHHPLFSSGQNGNSSRMRDAWRLLQQWGAEVVVSGHDHTYERFAPQDADGRATAYGVREFVVGTGGYSLYDLGRRQANSEVFENRTWGVIRFTLKKKSYEWEFVPIDGQTFRDSGSGVCSVLAER